MKYQHKGENYAGATHRACLTPFLLWRNDAVTFAAPVGIDVASWMSRASMERGCHEKRAWAMVAIICAKNGIRESS